MAKGDKKAKHRTFDDVASSDLGASQSEHHPKTPAPISPVPAVSPPATTAAASSTSGFAPAISPHTPRHRDPAEGVAPTVIKVSAPSVSGSTSLHSFPDASTHSAPAAAPTRRSPAIHDVPPSPGAAAAAATPTSSKRSHHHRHHDEDDRRPAAAFSSSPPSLRDDAARPSVASPRHANNAATKATTAAPLSTPTSPAVAHNISKDVLSVRSSNSMNNNTTGHGGDAGQAINIPPVVVLPQTPVTAGNVVVTTPNTTIVTTPPAVYPAPVCVPRECGQPCGSSSSPPYAMPPPPANPSDEEESYDKMDCWGFKQYLFPRLDKDHAKWSMRDGRPLCVPVPPKDPPNCLEVVMAYIMLTSVRVTVYMCILFFAIVFTVVAIPTSQIDIYSRSCYTFWGYKENCDAARYTYTAGALLCSPIKGRLRAAAAFSILSLFTLLVAFIASIVGIFCMRDSPCKVGTCTRIVIGVFGFLAFLFQLVTWALIATLYSKRYCENKSLRRYSSYGVGFGFFISAWAINTCGLLLLFIIPADVPCPD